MILRDSIGRRNSIPRSLSDPDVADTIRKFKLKSRVTIPIFNQCNLDIVTEYAELRCVDKLYDVFQHNDDVTIIVFKDTSCNRTGVFARGPILGKGQEGTVYLAQDLTSKHIKLVALKQRECTTRMSKKDCLNECKILEYLMYSEGFFRLDRSYYLFMTYLPGFNASYIPVDFPDVLKQAIAGGMLRALHSIHEVGILHGDIKPDNFMIEYKLEWVAVRIVDFGQSTFMSCSNDMVTGAPAYQPPECRSVKCPVKTRKTEYYSLAICQLEALSIHSFQEYQSKKSLLDPYLHSDLRNCCKDVFLSLIELEELRANNPWRHEILRISYNMYQEDINDRPGRKKIVKSISLLDDLESAYIKLQTRSSDSSSKIIPHRKKKAMQKLDLSQLYCIETSNDSPTSKSPSSPSSSPSLSPKENTSFPQKMLRLNSSGR
jgi:serine/threonine protein kinase